MSRLPKRTVYGADEVFDRDRSQHTGADWRSADRLKPLPLVAAVGMMATGTNNSPFHYRQRRSGKVLQDGETGSKGKKLY